MPAGRHRHARIATGKSGVSRAAVDRDQPSGKRRGIDAQSDRRIGDHVEIELVPLCDTAVTFAVPSITVQRAMLRGTSMSEAG